MTVTRPLTGLFAAALLLGGGPAFAESKETEEMRADLERLREEVEALKAKKAEAEKQKAHPQNPEAAPTMADRLDEVEVKQKDAVVVGDIPGSFRVPGTELSLKIYGFAELNYVHEFKGDNSDNDYSTFAPYVPLKGTFEYDRKNRDYLTARTSRLGVEAGTPTKFGVLSVKIEGDFNNEPRTGNAAQYGTAGNVITQQQTSSYGFRIRHAYGQFGGLLAGMTWSTFMDVDNSPETLDFNGPVGATFIRQPQIRYTYATPSGCAFTIAVENSSSYVLDETLSVLASSQSRMPDLVLRWDRGFDWGSMSARAMTQELRVDDGLGHKANYRGWGAGSTALVKARGGSDYLSLAVTYGDGIGRYLNYIEGAFYDPATNTILTERALGVVAGYQLKLAPWVRVNFVYGMTRDFDNAYTDLARANPSPGSRFSINRMVQQAHVGPIFTPFKGVDLGVELMWAQRQTLADEKGDMLRYNVSAKYYLN